MLATSFFGAYAGSTTTKLIAAVLLGSGFSSAGGNSVAVVTGVAGFAGTLVFCAAIGDDCSFSVSLSPGPGTNSYLQSRSRSTTTRVVALASVPIRTLFTPLLPT